MDINKMNSEEVKTKIQDLKNKRAVLENEITMIQHISARISMSYGESEDKIDDMLCKIAEINKEIKLLSECE